MQMLSTCGTLMAAAIVAAVAAQTALPAQGAAEIIKAIERDRADTQRWLRSDPESYLAATDRRDFGSSKALTVGRSADNDVRLDDPAVSPHHLRVAVDGDSFRISALDAPARFVAGGTPQRTATAGPSSIQVARFRLRLSHQGFPALIVFDPKSPHFKEYKGLKYFPIDLAYRYELGLVKSERPERVIVQSTRGNERPARRLGWFDFKAGSTPVRLEAVQLLEPGVGEEDISVFFRDATTGGDSYPVGRYVDVKRTAGGKYLLDFNLAYNPACAFSDYYNCPIPSKANTLAIAIRAGEMDSHYH
jgi:uncharacterized protein